MKIATAFLIYCSLTLLVVQGKTLRNHKKVMMREEPYIPDALKDQEENPFTKKIFEALKDVSDQASFAQQSQDFFKTASYWTETNTDCFDSCKKWNGQPISYASWKRYICLSVDFSIYQQGYNYPMLALPWDLSNYGCKSD
ncbi:hypothetical protein ABPG74_017493 [Tetrahymena malaccensis]